MLNGALIPICSSPFNALASHVGSRGLVAVKSRAGGGSFLSKPNVAMVSLRLCILNAGDDVRFTPAVTLLAICCSSHALNPTIAVALICTMSMILTTVVAAIESKNASMTHSETERRVEKPCRTTN